MLTTKCLVKLHFYEKPEIEIYIFFNYRELEHLFLQDEKKDAIRDKTFAILFWLSFLCCCFLQFKNVVNIILNAVL